MRFFHVADLHLGYQQYNLVQRFDDFFYALRAAIKQAIEQDVDVFVIAGDLFDKASIDPETLRMIEVALAMLHDAGIIVVAVHGNHDRVRQSTNISWLEYLAKRELLHLLSPDFSESPPGFSRYDTQQASGAYLDVDHVRIIGVPWVGGAAPKTLSIIADEMDSLNWDGIAYTLMVTHAGVEGQMPNMSGGLTFAELAPLQGRVNYLALGHLHKPYDVDGWIHNPGAIEVCSFDEARHDHGAYMVDVNADGSHNVQYIALPTRPFHTIRVETDFCSTPGDLLETVLTRIREERRTIARLVANAPAGRELPVVRLTLVGNLTFDRTVVDLSAIRTMLLEEIDVLHARVENRTTPLGLDVSLSDELDRDELEQTVIDNIVRSDTQYSDNADAWTQIVMRIKQMALDMAGPDEIFQNLDGAMAQLEDFHVDH